MKRDNIPKTEFSKIRRFIQYTIVFMLYQICKSNSATPFTIAKSQFTDSVSIASEWVPISNANPGTNLQIEFYVWISPLVANSLITDMQIIRLSSQQILNRTNEATTKVLLMSINQTELKIESILSTSPSVFSQKFVLKSNEVNLRGWNQVSIKVKDLSSLEIQFGLIPTCTIPATIPPITFPQLYLYVGQEKSLDLLPFSGYYAYQGSFVSSSLDPLTNSALWLNEGWSNKLISIRSLGTPLRKTFTSSDNLIIEDYSAKFQLKLFGTFLLKRQIFRLTLNDDVYDDRRLGYCICCVYVKNRILEFETYSYDLTNGLVNIFEKLTSSPLDLGKYYDIAVSYNWSAQVLSIYLNGAKVKDITSIQLAMQNFQLIYGGDFINDTFFSGKIKNIIVNYGVNSIASSSVSTTIPVCTKDTCATCLISSLSTCQDCLISLGDPNRDFSVDCMCQNSYYFNSNEVCMRCHYTCDTCSGSSNTECSSCISSRQLYPATNQCVCQSRTYDDGINSTCLPCHSDCVTCLSASSNQCTSCDTNKEVDATGSCVCSTGYSLVGSVCAACRSVCKRCNQAGQCLDCRENFELKSGECVCKTGFRLNEKSDCVPCSDNCLQCSTSACEVCQHRFEVISNECKERKFIPGSTSWSGSTPIFDYTILTLLIIDIFATTFINQFSFSRVFRLWQFLTKLFLLKLVEADFTEVNYNLLSSLSHFNGISFFFPWINFFGSSSTTYFSTKTKLEDVHSSILSSTGGQIFILFLLFIIVTITSLIARVSTSKPTATRQQSHSVGDESFRIDRPLNQELHQLNKPDESQNKQPPPSLILKITSSFQFIFWHFQELALQILCLGLVLNYADVFGGGETFNFFCVLIPIYVVGVCLLIRSFLILKPKIPQNLLYYKQIAVDNERKMAAKKLKEQQKALAPQNDQEEGMIILKSYNSNNSNEADLHPTSKPLRLSDSNCLRGLFRCLHMEFIPGYKSCKFFFWFYILSYILIATAIMIPKGSAKNQYLLLLVFQFIFVITSLFRPYQDLLESIKNIVDNIAFLVAIILQSVMSDMVLQDEVDFRLSQNQIDAIDGYSYSSFSILFLAIISITAISLLQAKIYYSKSKQKDENKVQDKNPSKIKPQIHELDKRGVQQEQIQRTHESIISDIDNGLIEMVPIDQNLSASVAGKYSELQYLPGSSFTKELDQKRASGDFSRAASQTPSMMFKTGNPMVTSQFDTDKKQGNLVNIFSSVSERGSSNSVPYLESTNTNNINLNNKNNNYDSNKKDNKDDPNSNSQSNHNSANNSNSNAVQAFNSNSFAIKLMESIREEEEVPQTANTIKGLFKPFTELHDIHAEEKPSPEKQNKSDHKTLEKQIKEPHNKPSRNESQGEKISPPISQNMSPQERKAQYEEEESEEGRDQSLSLNNQSPDQLLSNSYSSAYFPD